MASGHYGYRDGSKKYYDAAQAEKPRGESILNRARMGQSPAKEKEKKEEAPRRGRPPGRAPTYTNSGKREMDKNGP